MKRLKVTLFWLSLILFITLIAISIWLQSATFLFTASLLPLVIVPLFPDFRKKQWLRKVNASGHPQVFRVSHLEDKSPQLLLIRFETGQIRREVNRLFIYVDWDKLPLLEQPQVEAGAALTILRHDLYLPARKKGWVGIRLDQVIQRTEGLSFTFNEVHSFVIPYMDIQQLSAPTESKNTENG